MAGLDPWTVTVSLNTQTVEFHIDTGADVTVIPEKLYKKLKTSHYRTVASLWLVLVRKLSMS